MRGSISLLSILAILPWPSIAAAAPAIVADGPIEMRVDADAPVLACIVTRTSGDAAADDAACLRALAERGGPGDGFPRDAFIGADAEGRFVECHMARAQPAPPDFARLCAARLQALRRARSMVPLNLGGWIGAADLAGVGGAGGRVTARLGIDDRGLPTYCLILASSGNRRLDGVVCPTLLRRARFRPARDAEGRPMPSIFASTFNLRL
ncbi:MAG TPA: hypothetical protein VGW40_06920 [Allosphingosinicella sp.]|nr:hypothetical protein [Allosphingosinicella sp.]